jgi:hypothetical protein
LRIHFREMRVTRQVDNCRMRRDAGAVRPLIDYGYLNQSSTRRELLCQGRQRSIRVRGDGGDADSQCADLRASRSIKLDGAEDVGGARYWCGQIPVTAANQPVFWFDPN